MRYFYLGKQAPQQSLVDKVDIMIYEDGHLTIGQAMQGQLDTLGWEAVGSTLSTIIHPLGRERADECISVLTHDIQFELLTP